MLHPLFDYERTCNFTYRPQHFVTYILHPSAKKSECSMTRSILILCVLGLVLLLAFGVYSPANPLMLLASASTGFNILRCALLLVIFTLLVTEPPRNSVLRVYVGVLSIVLIGWSLSAFYQNNMLILDTLLLLTVGISTGTTVLERDVLAEEKPQKSFRKHFPKTIRTQTGEH